MEKLKKEEKYSNSLQPASSKKVPWTASDIGMIMGCILLFGWLGRVSRHSDILLARGILFIIKWLFGWEDTTGQAYTILSATIFILGVTSILVSSYFLRKKSAP